MGDALDHLSNRTKLEWQANLNTEYTPKRNHRRTSIIGTIGMSRDWRHYREMVPDSNSRTQDQLRGEDYYAQKRYFALACA